MFVNKMSFLSFVFMFSVFRKAKMHFVLNIPLFK